MAPVFGAGDYGSSLGQDLKKNQEGFGSPSFLCGVGSSSFNLLRGPPFCLSVSSFLAFSLLGFQVNWDLKGRLSSKQEIMVRVSGKTLKKIKRASALLLFFAGSVPLASLFFWPALFVMILVSSCLLVAW
jgi:hypothetical protein